jgi:hypothetical protein
VCRFVCYTYWKIPDFGVWWFRYPTVEQLRLRGTFCWVAQGPGKKWEHYKLNDNKKVITFDIHVKKGDTVQCITGRDKGKVGVIQKVRDSLHQRCMPVVSRGTLQNDACLLPPIAVICPSGLNQPCMLSAFLYPISAEVLPNGYFCVGPASPDLSTTCAAALLSAQLPVCRSFLRQGRSLWRASM